MAKASVWTSSVASVVAVTMAFLAVPAMAQASSEPSAASSAPVAVPGSSAQGVAPQSIAAPASSSTASSARAGSLQGFGPMQANPLLGAQPLQEGGGK